MSASTAVPALFQAGPGGGGGPGIALVVVYLVVIVATIAGLWKTFQKAGEPGWAAIIPLYNLWVMVKISDNAWWWLLIFFIPIISIVAAFKIAIDIGKQFGQGLGFGLGLAILPFIFYPLLGFGDYQYEGSAAGGDTGADAGAEAV